MTKKGKGYQPAEMNPGNYHGVSAFDPDGMPDPEVAPKESVFDDLRAGACAGSCTEQPHLRHYRGHEIWHRAAVLFAQCAGAVL